MSVVCNTSTVTLNTALQVTCWIMEVCFDLLKVKTEYGPKCGFT